MKQAFIPATMKFRGYFVTQLANGQWLLRGRGERRAVAHAELLNLVNSRPKKKVGAR